VCVYTYTSACVQVCVSMCTYEYVCASICTHMNLSTRTDWNQNACRIRLYTYDHVCESICIHMSMCVRLHVYI